MSERLGRCVAVVPIEKKGESKERIERTSRTLASRAARTARVRAVRALARRARVRAESGESVTSLFPGSGKSAPEMSRIPSWDPKSARREGRPIRGLA